MADDYTVRASITGDASSFKVAMGEAKEAAQSGVAGIKQALAEAQALSAVLAQGIKNDRDIIASIGEAKPGTGATDFLPGVKERLAETEKALESTRNRVAELKAELAGVPKAAAAGGGARPPDDPGGLNEKQLKLLAEAAESAARQLKSLPAIQEEVAARINASVNEMAAIRKRADAEVAESARMLGAIQVSGVVESGDARGQAALALATKQHTQALSVQQEVQARQAAVTAEAAAGEELLARATAQATNATLADAQAQVKATIEKEGSAVAALKVADAQEATLTGAQKQANAIANANQIIQRSTTAVAQIQSEVAGQVGISTERMETYIRRAAAELQKANAAIGASQIATGDAITAGNEEAIASMAALQAATENAAAVLASLKSQQADSAATQVAVAEAANAQASALNVVTEVTTAAAERGQNFATIQGEIAASIGKTSAELGGTYARAAAAARAETAALVRDSERLAPAIRQGIPGAVAAMANLRSQQQQLTSTARELAATQELKALIEKSGTATTQAAAVAQAELKIQQAGSAITALELARAEIQAANAMDTVAGSSNVARVAIAEASFSTQGMIFALSRVVAAIPGAQLVLRNLFPIITGIAFIAILDQMFNKVGDVIDAMAGMGKEAKKQLEEMSRDARGAFDAYLALQQKIAQVATVGLSGQPKLGVEAQNARDRYRELSKEQLEAIKNAAKLREALESTDLTKIRTDYKGLGPLAIPVEAGKVGAELGRRAVSSVTDSGAIAPGLPDRATAEKELEETDKQIKDLTAKMNDAQKALIPQIAAERAAEAFRQYIAEEEKALDVAKELALSYTEDQKKRAQEQYADKQIGYEKETELLRDAEEQRHQVEIFYAGLHENLNKERAAKGEVSAIFPATEKRQKIALEDAKHQREVDNIEILGAREKQKRLREINEENLKNITDRLPAIEEAAPEGYGKRAVLGELQTQQATIEKLPTDELDKYQKAFEYLSKEIPRLMGQATKETEKEVKDSVDEQYRAWERGGERSAVQILQFWGIVAAQAGDNKALAKEADEHITEATKKYLAETRKVTEELQKQQELKAEHADDVQKAAIERKYVTTPQTSLNPFALTPQQKEKQELGQVDLIRIQQKIELNLKEQETERLAHRDTLASYAKLQNDKIKLDNEYYAKKAALENEKLKDEYQNYLNYYNQISSTFFKGIDEWIMGQKRFSWAMMEAWKGIVGSVFQDIEKIAQKWIAEHIIMAGIAKLLGTKPQFNPGAGPGHGYGPPAPPLVSVGGAPVPVTVVGGIGGAGGGIGGTGAGVLFGNGGLLGTGGVPKISVPSSGSGGSQPKEYDDYGFRKRPSVASAVGDAASLKTGIAAAQDAATKENTIWQQQVQKYLGFNQQKVISDRITASQHASINVSESAKAITMEAQQAAEETTIHAAAKQTQVVATAAAEAEEMGLTATGAATSVSIEKTANATSILGAAKKRYAQVSANEGINSIPFVGPALAQAAGVAAFAATLAFLDTGGYIPKQGIAMLHPGEVVVNHPVTSLLSNIAARGGADSIVGGGSDDGGGSQRSGGDTHVHFSPVIHAVDTNGVGRMLEQHGKQFVRYLKAQQRAGRLT